jgi:hypothetical protein
MRTDSSVNEPVWEAKSLKAWQQLKRLFCIVDDVDILRAKLNIFREESGFGHAAHDDPRATI